MTAGVVGPDEGPTPSSLSSLSPPLLFSPSLSLSLSLSREREREREREPGIRLFFFALYTSSQAAKRRSFRGVCNFFSFRICNHCIRDCNEYNTFPFTVKSRLE